MCSPKIHYCNILDSYISITYAKTDAKRLWHLNLAVSTKTLYVQFFKEIRTLIHQKRSKCVIPLGKDLIIT